MKILYVTTISLTMNSFFKPHIEMLVREGNQVDIACNYKDLVLDNLYDELGCVFYQIDFSRSPLSTDNIKAYGQLKKVIENGNYDIIHCHTPNASVITRLVCRKFRKKNGLKVFYTAHGFHFYKGAPLMNWLFYYPIEWICSFFTNTLITINREDYERAKKHFHAKNVEYIPGIGIDVDKFSSIQVDKTAKRYELGISEEAFLLLSVGELNENKNHQIVIKAVAELKNPNIHYVVAGEGKLRDNLQSLATSLGISDQLHLLGYRNDIAEIYKISDLYVHPSFREGLPVAVMEAMASGTPTLVSHIRGCQDIVCDNLFEPDNLTSLINKLQNYCQNNSLNDIFSKKHITERIKSLYEDTACT